MAKVKAKPAMTADDIWGQIEPLVQARIPSTLEQRKEKLTELVWPELKGLPLIIWGSRN